MFQKALSLAGAYTFPCAGLRRKYDGTVFSTIAAFVVLNGEGWCVSARHILEETRNASLSVGQGRERLQAGDPAGDLAEYLSHSAEIWAVPGFDSMQPRPAEVIAHDIADFAVFRLEPFDASLISAFPLLRPPSAPIAPGLSVCRTGYPFHELAVTFEEERDNFSVTQGFPVPCFAMDGIVSRFRLEHGAQDRRATYIETSSPGLRGQSGGPLLDVEGRVCGIQSGTAHVDLGFDATYDKDGEKVVERQFLNVGQVVHVDEIRALLDEKGVAYGTSG